MKTDVFGLTINYKSWDKKQALPLYVAGNYEINAALPVYVPNTSGYEKAYRKDSKN